MTDTTVPINVKATALNILNYFLSLLMLSAIFVGGIFIGDLIKGALKW